MITLRRGQKRFIQLTSTHRLICFLARRQYGKTTLFAALAVLKMLQRRDHTIIFGSAKLNLSREIVRKEAAIIQAAIASASAPASPLLVYDAATNRARNRAVSATTTPELWISPWTVESYRMVDAACDRWLKRRATLRRRAREHATRHLPAADSAGPDCHNDPRG